MKNKTIRQSVTFETNPRVIYEMLMDSRKHARFTGEKAVISRKVGGKFTAYAGYINGVNLELVQDKKIVPYYTRAEIERGEAPVRGREILWVDDPIELFFLHVQCSGRVRLPGGETVRVGFAEHNGHPYKSIGKILVERGELSADKASMQGIKQWAARNPGKLASFAALVGAGEVFIRIWISRRDANEKPA